MEDLTLAAAANKANSIGVYIVARYQMCVGTGLQYQSTCLRRL
jgi:hypothetical protein